MNNELLNGRWVVGNVFGEDDIDPNITISHSIVIKSYNSYTEEYSYWDPWTDNCGVFLKDDVDNKTISIALGDDLFLNCFQFCR